MLTVLLNAVWASRIRTSIALLSCGAERCSELMDHDGNYFGGGCMSQLIISPHCSCQTSPVANISDLAHHAGQLHCRLPSHNRRSSRLLLQSQRRRPYNSRSLLPSDSAARSIPGAATVIARKRHAVLRKAVGAAAPCSGNAASLPQVWRPDLGHAEQHCVQAPCANYIASEKNIGWGRARRFSSPTDVVLWHPTDLVWHRHATLSPGVALH